MATKPKQRFTKRDFQKFGKLGGRPRRWSVPMKTRTVYVTVEFDNRVTKLVNAGTTYSQVLMQLAEVGLAASNGTPPAPAAAEVSRRASDAKGSAPTG